MRICNVLLNSFLSVYVQEVIMDINRQSKHINLKDIMKKQINNIALTLVLVRLTLQTISLIMK